MVALLAGSKFPSPSQVVYKKGRQCRLPQSTVWPVHVVNIGRRSLYRSSVMKSPPELPVDLSRVVKVESSKRKAVVE